MSKKGYQKRLPTVLVPAPRPAPEQAPELARVDVPAPDVRTEPDPRPASASAPATASVAVDRGRAAAPAPSRTGMIIAASAVGLLVALVAGVLLTSMLSGDDAPGPGAPVAVFGSTPPVPISAGQSYVDLRIAGNGDIEVTQWISAAEPLDRLRLELPDLAGADDVAASMVVVLADGEPVAGPDRITSSGATYVLDAASDVQIDYRLTGASVLSPSVTGRALAAAGMALDYEPLSRSETRVVRAPGVLSLSCGRPASVRLVPCGRETGADSWTVDLDGRDVADRVVVQLTLG